MLDTVVAGMKINTTNTGRVMEDPSTVTMKALDDTTVLAASTCFGKLFCGYQAFCLCILHHLFGENEFHKPVVISFNKAYRTEFVDQDAAKSLLQ
jgi:hypothetical protein